MYYSLRSQSHRFYTNPVGGEPSLYFQNADLCVKLPHEYKDAMFAFVEANGHLCAKDLWEVMCATTLAQAIDEVGNSNFSVQYV